ncbi:uncharacterized protein LOC128556608 [Mercenaria mercenaria]|uniref:uncharacterized protein LOC128556608 n=1 Tax=Mercenaria mercenaria TaxID=6596 RepID=UPI00234F235A|nr:uncharacterized protein LOC128556608 [Mercenaria mercenaria]
MPLVRNKTGWNPPKSKDKVLEEVIQSLKEYPTDSNASIKGNLSKNSKTALKTLLDNTSLIIKEADKGGAVVCMDKKYYRDKILEMLSDTSYYESIDEHADSRTQRLIHDTINKYGKGLMKEEKDYLLNFEYTTSYFYGLPKIHKSKIIADELKKQNSEYIKVPIPDDVPFRPIVGGPNSVTQRLSHFLDIILKPFCEEVPSFIRDDLDFLNYLPEQVEENSTLVTFDVISLYTNIPHDLGLEAVRFWIEKIPGKIETRFKIAFILKSLQIILQNNVFYFDGRFYVQKKGTAMGTRVAPTYATLVLGYLEETLYNNIKHRYSSEFASYLRLNWKRFLDDCFLILNKKINALEFLQELNKLHPSIQFTCSENDVIMPFLDILVKKSGNSITTDLPKHPGSRRIEGFIDKMPMRKSNIYTI